LKWAKKENLISAFLTVICGKGSQDAGLQHVVAKQRNSRVLPMKR